MRKSDTLGAVFLVSLAAGAAAVGAFALSQRPSAASGPGSPSLASVDPLPGLLNGGDPVITRRSGGLMPGNPDPFALGRREPPGVLG